MDAFAVVAEAYRRMQREHLTLRLCEAFEESTGEPLVPCTPRGLVLLLKAMQPKMSRHARRPESWSAKREGHPDPWGERAVKELLRRYKESGKVGAEPSRTEMILTTVENDLCLADSLAAIGGFMLFVVCHNTLYCCAMRVGD